MRTAMIWVVFGCSAAETTLQGGSAIDVADAVDVAQSLTDVGETGVAADTAPADAPPTPVVPLPAPCEGIEAPREALRCLDVGLPDRPFGLAVSPAVGLVLIVADSQSWTIVDTKDGRPVGAPFAISSPVPRAVAGAVPCGDALCVVDQHASSTDSPLRVVRVTRDTAGQLTASATDTAVMAGVLAVAPGPDGPGVLTRNPTPTAKPQLCSLGPDGTCTDIPGGAQCASGGDNGSGEAVNAPASLAWYAGRWQVAGLCMTCGIWCWDYAAYVASAGGDEVALGALSPRHLLPTGSGLWLASLNEHDNTDDGSWASGLAADRVTSVAGQDALAFAGSWRGPTFPSIGEDLAAAASESGMVIVRRTQGWDRSAEQQGERAFVTPDGQGAVTPLGALTAVLGVVAVDDGFVVGLRSRGGPALLRLDAHGQPTPW